MCLCDSTCVTRKSDKTNFIDTHGTTVCRVTVGVQFLAHAVYVHNMLCIGLIYELDNYGLRSYTQKTPFLALALLDM